MSFPKPIDFKNLTLQDALDYAIVIEEEARARYHEFSDQVGSRYPGDAADFFDAMVVNEEKHRSALADRRRALFGNAPANVSLDDIVDVEAPDSSTVRNFMSVRQALMIALNAEQKAFEFFDAALEAPLGAEVRALFTELRADEVDHKRMVSELLARTPVGDGPDRAWDEIDTPKL